ncbi:MAG: DUF3944 domain-containing protein [Candidatus Marinimicrobia bacterium]|nr:DUF3944 domain-containing protein [bacterium]MCG2716878.1 DUF3944 domain-containing protein [Candidatus Neomarinimicrobiota bacterium]
MAYKEDSDLEFLQDCSQEDLDILVDILTKSKEGSSRITEELTITDEYKEHYPNHNKYWNLIAAEVQCYGANSIATIFRAGVGVLYKEILNDVCDRMKVNYNKSSNIDIIETNLLMKVLVDSLENMDPEQLKELVRTLDLKTTNLTKQGVTAALQATIKFSGFAVYKTAAIIANAVAKAILGRGLTFAANASLMKGISFFAGPVGWVITGLWTILDIAGPAYRITIPSVVQIAYMRAKLKYGDRT